MNLTDSFTLKCLCGSPVFLDDICAFANGIYFEKIATDQCGRLDGVVFQMPQDEEVEV